MPNVTPSIIPRRIPTRASLRLRPIRQGLGCVLLAVATFSSPSTRAANWPQWRGPEFNGSSPETSLPQSFSKTEKVLWKVPLPGASAGTPAVWNDRIFLPSADPASGTLLALCLDAQSGAELWRRVMGTNISRDNRSNYAAPSPITDGRHVWFYTSLGELAAFDLAGTEIWRRNLQADYGEFAFLWTYSSSPLLFKDRLYVQVLQRDVPVSGRGRNDAPNDPYLLALDPLTGKELWRHIRPSEAVAESREAFSTPVPLLGSAEPEILLLGGDCITGHDPNTGTELWRWGTWNTRRVGHYRIVPSPVAGGGVVLACGPKGEPIFAAPVGKRGVLSNDALAWVSEDRSVSTDVPTPLYYRGRFYILNGTRKTLACVEPATGKVLWTGDLECRAPFESSPTGADGRIFCINHRGEVFVIGAGDTFNILHQTTLGDDNDRSIRSAIVPAQQKLFVRTDDHLYCFGD